MSAFTNDWFFFFSLLLTFPFLSFTSSIFHKITDYFTQNTNTVNKRTGWRTMDWCGKRLAELYILLLCCCGALCAMKFITLSLTRCILMIVLLIRPFNTLIIDFEGDQIAPFPPISMSSFLFHGQGNIITTTLIWWTKDDRSRNHALIKMSKDSGVLLSPTPKNKIRLNNNYLFYLLSNKCLFRVQDFVMLVDLLAVVHVL